MGGKGDPASAFHLSFNAPPCTEEQKERDRLTRMNNRRIAEQELEMRKKPSCHSPPRAPTYVPCVPSTERDDTIWIGSLDSNAFWREKVLPFLRPVMKGIHAKEFVSSNPGMQLVSYQVRFKKHCLARTHDVECARLAMAASRLDPELRSGTSLAAWMENEDESKMEEWILRTSASRQAYLEK